MTVEPSQRFAPLEPSRLDDWLAFFDGPAFADNRDWATCYCRCYVMGGCSDEEWERACATPGENREAMAERIRGGTVDGLLAYREGVVVGWVHFGPTSRFHSLLRAFEPVEPGVASIVCFVIAPEARRSGIARGLLRESCAELARRGFVAVDARPPVAPPDTAHLFPGPAALYLSEGFEVVESSAERQRVRRVLHR
jgi:ribosomal protein S18 acetylase RimI-like enzyme